MYSKKAIFQEHFNVSTMDEAFLIYFESLSAMGKDSSYSAYTKLQIPFEAPCHPPLPSWDEVEQGFVEYLKPNPMAGKAFRVGAFMVKFGNDSTIFQEAESLLFLQANSQVRVPKVYAAFTRPILEWTRHFLIMDYIEGETLSGEKWLSLSDTSRSIILSKLCEQFRLLRSIPSEGYYGCVNRHGWQPWFSFLCKMQPGPSGPFDTYEEFVAALTSSAHLIRAMAINTDDFHPEEVALLSRMGSELLRCNGRQPVFTHMDPSVGNTIIRLIPGPEGEEDWEVTLIDWAESGWLPAWMQSWCLREKLTMETTMHDPNGKESDQYVEYVTKNLEGDYTKQLQLFDELRKGILYGLL
ncbi:hypothetical protein BDU57DRAFT_469409 [Ampelomyces quisqualis]|uniref:Aminoglycoside phosphotransferase domain-containing protein n=1 Tax=Ampelomyces quisqualis TaxID=50730 RepID=A0A6A5QWT0_AMPQU|nr:hypothetical protein BDU57DRAFT_469409 [Ampelomyces quisqualis]